MVNRLLKIEKIGQQLLRGGIALYLASIVYFTFSIPRSTGLAQLHTGLISLLLIGILFLLLFHYKNPRAGILGGIGAILFFIISAFWVGYEDYSDNTAYSMIFLHTIKDILLAFGALVLTGESVKEMIRQKITQPFPKR